VTESLAEEFKAKTDEDLTYRMSQQQIGLIIKVVNHFKMEASHFKALPQLGRVL